MAFDVQLLGNCDTIVAELCRMAGWELKHEKLPGGTSNLPDMDKNTNLDGAGTGGRAAWSFMEPNTYLFEGALLEELDFEAVKEKNRNRGQDEQGQEFSGEEQEDEDVDADAILSDEDGIEGIIAGASSGRPLPENGVRSDSSDDDEADDAVGVSALPSIDPATNLAAVRHPIVGIALGTTQPRSGSITEIHQIGDLSRIQSSLDESSPSLTQVDDSTLLKQMHYTETMPKDIDEDRATSKSGDTHGHHLDPTHRHSRQPSAELVSITEDALLEVDDVEEQENEPVRSRAASGTS